jgi:hypothetical protein
MNKEIIADDLMRKKRMEYLQYCREKENDLRCQLASAVQDTRRAKEKYETFFTESEQQAALLKKKESEEL